MAQPAARDDLRGYCWYSEKPGTLDENGKRRILLDFSPETMPDGSATFLGSRSRRRRSTSWKRAVTHVFRK